LTFSYNSIDTLVSVHFVHVGFVVGLQQLLQLHFSTFATYLLVIASSYHSIFDIIITNSTGTMPPRASPRKKAANAAAAAAAVAAAVTSD
jgi:hypothetical protein